MSVVAPGRDGGRLARRAGLYGLLIILALLFLMPLYVVVAVIWLMPDPRIERTLSSTH